MFAWKQAPLIPVQLNKYWADNRSVAGFLKIMKYYLSRYIIQSYERETCDELGGSGRDSYK